MARYIDVEKIKYHKLPVCGGHGLNFEYTVAYKHEVDAIPTADVVPRAEVELLKRQLEPFKEVQCFTCKHYDIGHDHVPCCYCEDYDKYIWLSADANTDIHTANEGEVGKGKADVAREIFKEIEKALNLSKCYGESGIYFEHDIEADIAELKKKYVEGEE